MIKKILLLLMFLPVYLLAWKMESGRTTLPATTVGSSTWQTITLQQTYDTTPLIFVFIDEGSGYSADEPVSLRIRNRSTAGFEIVQVEPQSSVGDVEGEHAAVNVHYVAIEAGDHTLSDGTRILAGIHNTDSSVGKNDGVTDEWDTVNFPSSFSNIPVVLAGVQSINNETSTLPGASSSPWMATALESITVADFDISLERAETSVGSINVSEDIGYLAIESGVQSSIYDTTCNAISYETIRTSDSVTGWDNLCYGVNFINSYTTVPNVVGTKETRDGGDGGWLRRCSLTNTTVGVTVDEDQAGDAERSHTTEIAGLFVFEKDFIYNSAFNTIGCGLSVEYRMDECYWLNGTGGATGDVKDSSPFQKDATSEGTSSVTINTTNPPLYHYGTFGAEGDRIRVEDITVPSDLTNALTISTWLYPASGTAVEWIAAVMKTSNENWSDGFGFANNSSSNDNIKFFVNGISNSVSATLDLNTWNHIVGVYDGNTLKIYKNGIEADSILYSSTINTVNESLFIGNDIADTYDDKWLGSIDEVKVWGKALSTAEVGSIFNQESAGKNYDGTDRSAIICDATIAANSWELVGVPIDLRTDPKTVRETFQGMNGTYGTNWRVYRKDYSDSNNSSWYTYLDDPDNNMTEFGKAYWLGNKQSAQNWNVNGTQAVDYDSTHPDCPASQCVEIDVKSVSVDFTTEPSDGTGPYRYNMTGFTGKSTVSWADCRFIINGTAYTPTKAENEGYASKVIWQFNPGNSGADANGYTVCDDTGASGVCLLEPYKGFLIELHGPTKNIPVKLLIPQE